MRTNMTHETAKMSEVRIPYLQDQMGQQEIDEKHDLIIKKRGGGERRIKAGRWWINRRTSVGEDGEVIERLPNFGRRFIDPCKIIATVQKVVT